jgi:hypothetical protein
MEQYFNQLFAGQSRESINSFMELMRTLRDKCETEIQDDYIREGMRAARTQLHRMEAAELEQYGRSALATFKFM